MALSFVTPALLAAVVFIPYSQAEGKPLTAAVVFSTMAYFIAVSHISLFYFCFLAL